MRMSAGQEVGKIETRLRQLGTKLDRLAALGAEMATDSQLEYRKQIDHIKGRHTAVLEQLQRFKDAGGQKWESFKGNIELAWSDLEQAFKGINKTPPTPSPTEIVSTPES
jgi:hypothetical protein